MTTLSHKKKKKKYRINALETVRKKANLKVLYKRLAKKNKRNKPTKF